MVSQQQETSRLGSEPNYMKKLLELVRHHVAAGQVNITLKFTLSALWNLTDESPSTCSVFLNEGGMALFLLVLSTFPNDVSIETKVLGLLNNIAEVRELRETILVDGFVSQLRYVLATLSEVYIESRDFFLCSVETKLNFYP